MSNRIDIINVESVESNQHTSSILQPDTLFHFMEKVEWLIDIIEKKGYLLGTVMKMLNISK